MLQSIALFANMELYLGLGMSDTLYCGYLSKTQDTDRESKQLDVLDESFIH